MGMSDDFDVVVVGGGLGGLIAAAILGRAGRRVLLLEREDALGGRIRSFEIEGGYVVDAGAYLWPDAHFSEALERTGAEDFQVSEIPRERVLRLYAAGQDGHRLAFPFPARAASEKLLASVRIVLGLDRGQYEELIELWQRLASLSDGEVDALRGVSMSEALPSFTTSAAIAEAFGRNVMLYGTYDPTAASMAECIGLCRPVAGHRQAVPVVAGLNPVGGVRALVKALEKAVAHAGVETRLSSPVKSIDIAGGRVTGVSFESVGGLSRARASRVVSNLPPWQLFDIAPRESFTPDFVRDCARWSAVGGVIAAAYCFDGLPCLRETGKPDEFPGWTRVLTGSNLGFGGGLLWATHHSPRNAPAGRHILQAMRL